MMSDPNGVTQFNNDPSGIDFETDGAFRIDGSRRFKKFVDGISKTVVASELLAGRDEVYSATDRVWDCRGMWAWEMMGSFAYTHRDTPNTSVGDAMYAAPGSDVECVPSPDMPCDNTHGSRFNEFHVAARSRHPGGVNVVFGDAHVTFINETIDWDIWQALATIAGSEASSGEY